MRPTHNLHVHSRVSLCAKEGMDLPAIIQAAQRAGIEIIGLADHIDEPGDSRREALVLANRSLLAAVESPVRVLVGTETTVVSVGRPAASEHTRQSLDFVSASVNHYHLPNVEHPAERTPSGYASHHLEMMRAAVECPYVDIIVHPFWHPIVTVPDQREVLAAYDREEMRRTLELMARRGVRMELNPGHVARGPDFFAEVVEMGRQVGLKFVVGTDAHRLQDIAYSEQGLTLLEQIGLQENDISLPPRVLARFADVTFRGCGHA